MKGNQEMKVPLRFFAETQILPQQTPSLCYNFQTISKGDQLKLEIDERKGLVAVDLNIAASVVRWRRGPVCFGRGAWEL